MIHPDELDDGHGALGCDCGTCSAAWADCRERAEKKLALEIASDDTDAADMLAALDGADMHTLATIVRLLLTDGDLIGGATILRDLLRKDFAERVKASAEKLAYSMTRIDLEDFARRVA